MYMKMYGNVVGFMRRRVVEALLRGDNGIAVLPAVRGDMHCIERPMAIAVPGVMYMQRWKRQQESGVCGICNVENLPQPVLRACSSAIRTLWYVPAINRRPGDAGYDKCTRTFNESIQCFHRGAYLCSGEADL